MSESGVIRCQQCAQLHPADWSCQKPPDDLRDTVMRAIRTIKDPPPGPERDRSYQEAQADRMAEHWAAFYRGLIRRGIAEELAIHWTTQRMVADQQYRTFLELRPQP